MSAAHTDLELLELAAQGGGIRPVNWNDGREPYSSGQGFVLESGRLWNPLTDDGDALRLAVKLRIDIEWDEQPAGRTVEAYQRGEERCFCATEAEADYRRAIVRAAAAIGEAIP